MDESAKMTFVMRKNLADLIVWIGKISVNQANVKVQSTCRMYRTINELSELNWNSMNTIAAMVSSIPIN